MSYSSTPKVKLDNRHVQVRLEVPEIKPDSISPAEEPMQPQPQRVLRQRRLRHHQQNHPRHPSRSLPTHSYTIAHICRPRPDRCSPKTLALSASARPSLTPDESGSLVALTALPLSPLAGPLPHAPGVTPNNRHVDERLEVSVIKSSNVLPAEEPKGPQSQRVLRQRRLRRHQQNRPRHPSRPLPAHLRTVARICRPHRRSLKMLALSASTPPDCHRRFQVLSSATLHSQHPTCTKPPPFS